MLNKLSFAEVGVTNAKNRSGSGGLTLVQASFDPRYRGVATTMERTLSTPKVSSAGAGIPLDQKTFDAPDWLVQ